MRISGKAILFQSACALVLVSASAIAQMAQTSPATRALGSVSGTVTDAATGAPIANVVVAALQSGRPSVRTDAEGRYALRDLDPGQYRLVAIGPGSRPGIKEISVNAGQLLTRDFRLKALGQISGRVVDENGEPVPGVDVMGLVATYRQGAVAYVFSGFGRPSNDRGEYVISNVIPDMGRILMAVPAGTGSTRPQTVDAVSIVPDDPKQRRRVIVLSFYPDATSPETAQAVTIRPGEQREHVDIRLRRAPSYCVEGVLGRLASQTDLDFVVARQGAGNVVSSIGGFAGRITDPDGKIRVCDLTAGDYGLDVTAISAGAPVHFGFTTFSVSDRDVRNIRVALQPAAAAPGEVVLEGVQPAEPLKGDLSISLTWRGQDVEVVAASLPGRFSFRLFPLGDYFVTVRGVPNGWYLKDVTYGGMSVLHRVFRPASFVGNAGFRVVLARDGGYAAITLTDADGKPVTGGNVTIFPARAASDAELADMIVSGSTDQSGRYQTAMLPPGKYYALALETPVEQTPDSMARLRGARSKATEVTLNAGATAQVTLHPIEGY